MSNAPFNISEKIAAQAERIRMFMLVSLTFADILPYNGKLQRKTRAKTCGKYTQGEWRVSSALKNFTRTPVCRGLTSLLCEKIA